MNRALIARHVWHQLWQDYSHRVEYARIYQQMIEDAGGTVANDHIAFRSLRLVVESPHGNINLGIPYLERIIQALGYEIAGEYEFPVQHLYARHYRHPEQERYDLPKLFISELIVDHLPDQIADLILRTVRSGEFCDTQTWERQLEAMNGDEAASLFKPLLTRPWPPPKRSVVEAVNAVSQYGAWVLLHGYAVNHFTGYVNRQQTAQYPDIEHTAGGLAERGVPMKAEIEGSQETGLRQTATQATTEQVTVADDASDQLQQMVWTYAYYELAERNVVEVAPGQKALFEGFLSAQAKHLFEMTRKA